MEVDRGLTEEDDLDGIDSATEHSGGILGKSVEAGEEAATFVDLKYEEREMLRSESLDSGARRQRLHESIIANVSSDKPLRLSYFVREPGL